MPGILDPVHVLDLTQGTAGPITTMILADHGAHVTRVEPPGGDPHRQWDGYREAYHAWNRGKQSITLNIETPEGRDLLRQLLATTDILVESAQPGEMARLGLDYASLHDAFPRLIYCSITAYGSDGPEGKRPGDKVLAEARLGLQYQQGGGSVPGMPGADGPVQPKMPGWASIACGTAFQATVSLMAALWARETTGRGQWVESSLLDGHLGMSAMGLYESSEPPPVLRLAGTAPNDGRPVTRFITGYYRCADGEYVQVHTGAAGSADRLLDLLGLGDMIVPPKPGEHEYSATFSPAEHQRLVDELPGIFAAKPREEWIRLLTAADVPHSPLRRMGESLLDEHARVENLAVSVDDPELGRLVQAANPVRLSLTPPSVRSGAPLAGQDTSDILGRLGLGESELERLAASGIV